MTSNLKFLTIAFALSLIFFGGVNYLEKNSEDFFFLLESGKNHQFFTAQASLYEKWKEMQPIRINDSPDITIEAKSAISVLAHNEGGEKTLFEKEAEQKLPIASLSKLMTAYIVLKHYDLSEEIIISKEAANQYGDIKNLQEGRIFPVKYLLYPLLMESSNGAAFALANDYSNMTEEKFVGLMNSEAQEMGLENTFFSNPSGLDPDDLENEKTEINHSTAKDLAKLAKKLLEEPLIWEIVSISRYSDYGPELINTNKFLLDNNNDWQERIVGGKTGYTAQAGGCLLLVVKPPKSDDILINIILGANGREDRFQEMKKLVDWLKSAYKW